jgi:hypothetical protein
MSAVALVREIDNHLAGPRVRRNFGQLNFGVGGGNGDDTIRRLDLPANSNEKVIDSRAHDSVLKYLQSLEPPGLLIS